MIRMPRVLTVAMLALAASLGLAPAAVAAPVAPVASDTVVAGPVAADVQDFRFSSLDVDFTLVREDDGTSSMEVVERFTAVFPDIDQNRGMQRVVPDTYLGAPLHPELVSITDGEGDPRPVEVDDGDDGVVWTSRADDYVHGEQVYVFTYTVENVVRYFGDADVDELQWNVLGVDWAQPFDRVNARLHVDDELAAALTGAQACYLGDFGATERCDIVVGEAADGVEVVADASGLTANQAVTIAVGFAPGTFVPFDAGYFASPWGWVQAAGVLGLLGSIVWAARVRARRLRDEPGRPVIVTEFTPPPTVDALESAVLLAKPDKAIAAEVLEQAVVGSIRIVEAGKKAFGGVKLEAHLVDPSKADGDGRMLLDGLFGEGAAPGAVFAFGTQDTRFSAAARKILAAAGTELSRRGLRRDVPARDRAWPAVAAFVSAAVVVGAGVLALTAAVVPWVPLPLLIAAVPVFFVVLAMVARKPLTAVGAETRDHLKGLKIFIDWAEADRIRMLQSPEGAERTPVDTDDPRQMLHLYERLLPYAVVFGQEKEWAARLIVLYGTAGVIAPAWYIGTSGSFDASAFSAGIGSLSASAMSASSTSGSGGGGSAGGGGGGGGGGGV